MDVARLNMSHDDHEDCARAYRLVREAADATGHGVGLRADLQGAARREARARCDSGAGVDDRQPVGEYPVEAVEVMATLIAATERHALSAEAVDPGSVPSNGTHTPAAGSFAKAAAEVAERVDAKYVVASTQSRDS